MQVFVAGSTGVLGKRLVSELVDRGHDAVGLVRDEAGERAVRERGGEPRYGDVLDRESLDDAAAGSDVVVHAATAIPTDAKPSDEDWARNDRIRREGAENLTDVAAAVGADRYLQQSVTWLARNEDGSPFDKSADPNPQPSTESALDAERIALEAADERGFELVVLRGGWFYAPDSAHTRQIGEGLENRQMPIIAPGLLGRGDATLSVVHVEDAARAFASAAEGSATGTYHVVDDEPVAVAEYFRTFADLLNAPSPFRIPGWLAGLLVGESTVDMFTHSAPTSNERFRRDFDWEPRYPTYREGLKQVVAEWERSADAPVTASSSNPNRASGD